MIEGISAVTLGAHEMPRAVRFYRALGLRPRRRGAAARLSQLSLEKRALAATADGKRRSAGQRERIDVAVDAPRLLGVAEPE